MSTNSMHDVKSSVLYRVVLKLLGWLGISLGIALLAIAAIFHILWPSVLVLDLIAIVAAEMGAVLLTLSLLHMAYENLLREEHREDVLRSLEAVVEQEFQDPKNLNVFIRGARSDYANYESFLNVGIRRVHYPIGNDEWCNRLGSARSIRVLKTWFPEFVQLEDGLRDAIVQQNAHVELLLCHPDSTLLETRSIGAGEAPELGSQKNLRALKLMNRFCRDGQGSFEVGLFDHWPGVPIICYDATTLIGFYFRDVTSPHSPCLEIERDSNLAGIIDSQFKSVWNKVEANDKLCDCTELARRLDELYPGWQDSGS